MGADDELLPDEPTVGERWVHYVGDGCDPPHIEPAPDDGLLLEARDDGRVWIALLACAALGAAGLAIAIVDLVTH